MTQLKAIIGEDYLIDATLHLIQKAEHSLDTILGLGMKFIDYLLDGILFGKLSKEIQFDSLLSQTFSINYLTSVYLLMTASLQYTINSIFQGRYSRQFALDSIIYKLMTAAYLTDVLLLQKKECLYSIDTNLKLPVGRIYYFIDSVLKGRLVCQYIFTTDLIKGLYIDTLRTSMAPVYEIKTTLSDCLGNT